MIVNGLFFVYDNQEKESQGMGTHNFSFSAQYGSGTMQ